MLVREIERGHSEGIKGEFTQALFAVSITSP